METKKYENLLGRSLNNEEKERLHRIKNTLNLADNDALWDILIAVDFQRTFYENIPKEIEEKTQGIFEKLSAVTEKEIQLAQGRLAEKVIARADTLALQKHGAILTLWGIVALAVLLTYSSILVLAGYCMALEKIQPWAFLSMPVGILIGGLCLLAGAVLGIMSAKRYANGDKPWYTYMVGACVAFAVSAAFWSLTFFVR